MDLSEIRAIAVPQKEWDAAVAAYQVALRDGLLGMFPKALCTVKEELIARTKTTDSEE